MSSPAGLAAEFERRAALYPDKCQLYAICPQITSRIGGVCMKEANRGWSEALATRAHQVEATILAEECLLGQDVEHNASGDRVICGKDGTKIEI
jgi:hypothetical protein